MKNTKSKIALVSNKAFTLIELLVIIAIIALLAAIMIPSLYKGLEMSKMAKCSNNLNTISKALEMHTSSHDGHWPGFAFSTSAGAVDLTLSGHFGGDMGDTSSTGRHAVNFYKMVADAYLDRDSLFSPHADPGYESKTTSFFKKTDKFSSYCLRMPNTPDLFNSPKSMPLKKSGDAGCVYYYRYYAGGKYLQNRTKRMPRVHKGKKYALYDGSKRSKTYFRPDKDAIVADGFWQRDVSESGGAYDVVRESVHDNEYHVLYGTGNVKLINDSDRFVETKACPAGSSAPVNVSGSSIKRAREIWQFFEEKR